MQQIGLQIQAQIHRLNHLQKQLTAAIYAEHVSAAVVYQLPDIEPDQSVAHTRPIEVTPCYGTKALETGTQALINLHAKSNHSTRFAVRMPGVLSLKVQDFSEMQHCVAEINAQKDLIKKTLLQVQDANQRYKLLHDPFPLIITLNVYRKIRLLTLPQLIQFNWANKKSITKVSKYDVLKRLYAQKEQCETLQQFDGAQKVQQEIQLVSQLSDHAPLRINRTLPMQPIANINKKESQFICTTPIIVLHDTDQAPEIWDLKHYDPDKNNHRYRSSHNWLPIIPRINLYLKE